MSEPSLRVSLEVFSGRSNPTWTLDAERSRELARCVARLSLVEKEELPPPTLGYRGFTVERVGAAGGPQPWLRVRGGVVAIDGPSARTAYRDTEGLEAMLRDEAIRRGLGRLVGGDEEESR